MRLLDRIPDNQLTAIVITTILYLTLLPAPFGEMSFMLFPGADKLVHACMFGGLTLTYIFERHRQKRTLTVRGALTAALCATVFGIAIEFLQEYMNLGRSGDWLDALADTVGAFTAVPVCYKLHWIHVIVNRRP